MASKRTYWAITALGIGPEGVNDGDGVATAKYLNGVQSVGISTTFNLEQVFQLGQLEIYQDVEEVPDKKDRGTIIKLVADAMWSNFSAHNPTIIPIELRIKAPKNV